jgi:uncharacterized cupredoxin-like copper-binding protein
MIAPRALIGALVLTGLVATACGSDPGRADRPIATTLTDYQVGPARTANRSGSTSFALDNRSGSTTHEFVVVKTDLDPADLPKDADGAFDEKGAGVEFVDEKENIGPGQQAALTVDLAPGQYVLLCNLEDHYARGMYRRFEVTP